MVGEDLDEAGAEAHPARLARLGRFLHRYPARLDDGGRHRQPARLEVHGRPPQAHELAPPHPCPHRDPHEDTEVGVIPVGLGDDAAELLKAGRLDLDGADRWGRGRRRDVPVDPPPPHALAEPSADQRMDPPHRRRRQAAPLEVKVEPVEVRRPQLPELDAAQPGPDPLGHKAPVLGHRRRREVPLGQLEPRLEELADGARRDRLLGLDLGDKLRERRVRGALATVEPARPVPLPARDRITPRIGPQLPDPRPPLPLTSPHGRPP